MLHNDSLYKGGRIFVATAVKIIYVIWFIVNSIGFQIQLKSKHCHKHGQKTVSHEPLRLLIRDFLLLTFSASDWSAETNSTLSLVNTNSSLKHNILGQILTVMLCVTEIWFSGFNFSQDQEIASHHKMQSSQSLNLTFNGETQMVTVRDIG